MLPHQSDRSSVEIKVLQGLYKSLLLGDQNRNQSNKQVYKPEVREESLAETIRPFSIYNYITN
jgi:hypothetical protein